MDDGVVGGGCECGGVGGEGVADGGGEVLERAGELLLCG